MSQKPLGFTTRSCRGTPSRHGLVHILVREIPSCFREGQDLAAQLLEPQDRELARHYRHPPHRTGETIRKRREGQPPYVIETARKAEVRLYRKFTRMVMRGKRTTVAAVAVARELAGFVWAIGRI